MENASNALIIAGGILIAITVLSMGVLLFSSFTKVGETYEQAQATEALIKFNSKFTIFEERTDITAQEIVTLFNFVYEYNKKNDPDIIINMPAGITNIDLKFLKDFSVDSERKYNLF